MQGGEAGGVCDCRGVEEGGEDAFESRGGGGGVAGVDVCVAGCGGLEGGRGG